jgi:FG-GAP repeat protein
MTIPASFITCLARAVRRALPPAALACATATAWAAFPFSVNLADLNGTTGTRADGIVAGDFLGYAVNCQGDLNGDGLADCVLGAPSSGSQPGSVTVVFGVAGGLPFPVDLATLNGGNGLRIDGVAAGGQSGSALAMGDVNGDGVSDLAIGAPGESAVYVVFGRAGGFPAGIDLATLDGTNGLKLRGPAGAASGYSLSLGDVNGDGIADLAIGNGAGTSDMGYVLYGHPGAAAASVDLAALSGTDGIRLGGGVTGYVAVAAAGDVNGDGIGDLLVGSPNAGVTHVLFGRPSFGGATVDVSDPQLASKLTGMAGSWFGFAVAGAGDVNGDGIADIVVGAPLAALSAASPYAGKSYVVFGSSAFPASRDASTLAGGNGGFQIAGAVRNDRSGWSVSAAGDVNGDGIGDVVIGAPYSSYAGSAGGAAYVIFGKTGGFQNLSLAGGLTGANGFQAVAPGATQAGFSVSAGDVNGDGAADVVIGGRLASPNGVANAGVTYLLYGQPAADTTAPSIVASRTPAANAKGWNNTSVTVSFSCSDAQSGVKSCSAATTLAVDGANQSVTGTAVDMAGNSASVTVTGISIDKSAPLVSVTGVVAGKVYNATPAPGCAARDTLSGVAVAPTLTVVQGVTVKGVATYTATCSGARDNADNQAATVSVTYGVKGKA